MIARLRFELRFEEMAERDRSPVVLLYLTSAALRLPESYGERLFDVYNKHVPTALWEIDASDPNVPLVVWYAIEVQIGLNDKNKNSGLTQLDSLVYKSGKIPLQREFLVRRVASIASPEAVDVVLVELLSHAKTNAEQIMILRNILLGLKGHGQIAKPEHWDTVVEKETLLKSQNAELRSLAYSLGVVFGDDKAMQHMREELASTKADVPSRQAALTALLDVHNKELAPVLQKPIGEKAWRVAAIRARA